MFLGVAVQVVANVVTKMVEFGFISLHIRQPIIADHDPRRFTSPVSMASL